MKLGLLSFAAMIGMLSFSACSSTVQPPTPYGMEHVTEVSSQNRPSWVDNPGEFKRKNKDRKYFVGVSSGVDDYEMLRVEARTAAYNDLGEQILTTVNTLEGQSMTGDSTGRYGKDGDIEKAVRLATIAQAKTARISGAAIDKYYWKKFWIQDSPGAPIQYYRKVYALGSISRENWHKTMEQTLHGVNRTVRNPVAKRLVKKMINKYALKDNKGTPGVIK